MAVDHASMFVARAHSVEFWGTPLPSYPDAFWFLTRWLTHMCAPGFFFLMGMGMVMFAGSRRRAGWSEGRIFGFFAARGLLLIALQLLVENPAWMAGSLFAAPGAMVMRGGPIPGGGTGGAVYLGVLFALGSAMIFWAFMIRLPSWLIGVISLAAVALTEIVVPGPGEVNTLYPPLLRVLLIPGHTDPVVVFYPIIPWLAPCGLGLIFGRAVLRDTPTARRWALWTGIVLAIIFLLLRIHGGFGNLNEVPPGWMGFLNVVKYPPSLSFLALALAINLLLMASWRKIEPFFQNRRHPLLVFGRAPLFFYLLHLWLYALLGVFFPRGNGLPALYAIWLLGLAVLYPLCLLYVEFKAKKPVSSLWRFF
jgi:uncharacterized membrane protein